MSCRDGHLDREGPRTARLATSCLVSAFSAFTADEQSGWPANGIECLQLVGKLSRRLCNKASFDADACSIALARWAPCPVRARAKT